MNSKNVIKIIILLLGFVSCEEAKRELVEVNCNDLFMKNDLGKALLYLKYCSDSLLFKKDGYEFYIPASETEIVNYNSQTFGDTLVLYYDFFSNLLNRNSPQTGVVVFVKDQPYFVDAKSKILLGYTFRDKISLEEFKKIISTEYASAISVDTFVLFDLFLYERGFYNKKFLSENLYCSKCKPKIKNIYSVCWQYLNHSKFAKELLIR